MLLKIKIFLITLYSMHKTIVLSVDAILKFYTCININEKKGS